MLQTLGNVRMQNGAFTARSSSFCSGRSLVRSATNTQRHSRSFQLEVVAGKGKGKKAFRGGAPGTAAPTIPSPPVDPNNAEFVIFVRSVKLPQWIPLSIVKGGNAANLLIKSMESDWGKKLYANTLIKNIGNAVYKDKVLIEKNVRTQFPPLKDAKQLEFGFKIRDKENPKSWMQPTGVIVIPPEEDLKGTVIDNIKDFFSGAVSSVQSTSS